MSLLSTFVPASLVFLSILTPNNYIPNEEIIVPSECKEVNTDLPTIDLSTDSAMLLPLGMCTKMVDKRNLRNLIDMSHQRMCTRAYHEYRDMFNDICDALRNYSEEWAYLVDKYFMPKCEYMGFCTEKKSCGRKGRRDS